MSGAETRVVVPEYVWEPARIAAEAAVRPGERVTRVLGTVLSLVSVTIVLLSVDGLSDRIAWSVASLMAVWALAVWIGGSISDRRLRRSVSGLHDHVVPALVPAASPTDLARLLVLDGTWVGPRYVLVERGPSSVVLRSPLDATIHDYPGYPVIIPGAPSGGP